ncbi:MAG TPA: MFS transporter [Gammaproteobacteria bacterium]
MPRSTESKHVRTWVLITAILGSSLVFLEGSVVSLALPSLQSDMHAASLDLQWVVNAYMLMLGAFMLISGSLGDRFGMRRVFMLGSLIFCLGAGACGFAPDFKLLIIARVVQGAGGALLVPACLALISLHYAGAARGRAIGIWAGASALTTSAGPLLGGWLVDTFGWHSVFLLLGPWALVGVALAWGRVPKDEAPKSAIGLDYAGAALLAAALSLGIYSFSGSGGTRWVLVAAALICGAGFIWREAKAKAPMLPLGLFRSWPFSGANLMTFLLYGAMSGGLYFLPFDFMQVLGFSALQAGMAFLPFAVILGFGSVFAASLIRRFDPRWVLSIGPCVTALGFLLLTMPGPEANYFTGFFPGIVVMGIGMTVSVTPLTTVVMQSLDAHHAGIASGVNNTASRLAGVLSVAGMTALAVGLFAPALAHELQSAGIPGVLAAHLQAGAGQLAELTAPSGTSPVLRQAIHNAIGLAYVRTFRWVMVSCALLAAAGGVVAWFSLAKYPARGSRRHTA